MSGQEPQREVGGINPEKLGITGIQTAYYQGSGVINEDELLINGDLFAVFDGSSSLLKFQSPDGKTGGKIAAETARLVFETNQGSLRELALSANRKIHEQETAAGIDLSSKDSLWATTAAAVRIGLSQIELLQVADSLILVITSDGKVSPPLGYRDHDLPVMRKWRQLADRGEKNIWDRLNSDIIGLRQTANVGYGVLNGEDDAAAFIQTTTIERQGIESILLFTDGLLIPGEDPDAPEDWEKYADIYRRLGLDGLVQHVRGLEDSDPQQTKFPRYKPHDDIAAIAIDFAA